jgi:RNA polymerase sigma-70 factor (sigma-E family)
MPAGITLAGLPGRRTVGDGIGEAGRGRTRSVRIGPVVAVCRRLGAKFVDAHESGQPSAGPRRLVRDKKDERSAMLWSRRFDGLETLVAERGNALLASAVLLTGSRAAGEDLLQAALERLMRSWGRVNEDRERYLRRTMYHLAVDQWRRRGRRPEVFISHEPPSAADATDALDLRDALSGALAELPPRQRAVLVLRYWEQLSEAEAADVLGCSVGTVKSTASRGLSRLRELTATWDITTTNGTRR